MLKKFKRRKYDHVDLSEIQYKRLSEILKKIREILISENLLSQSNIINTLIELAGNNEKDTFIKLINGVDMWGGAGAVWEVHIENEYSSKTFELEMIKLINLMEEYDILGRGIKPIRRLFMRNMH